MKKLFLIMTTASLGFLACNSGENTQSATNDQTDHELSATNNTDKIIERTFVYQEGNVHETIKIQFSDNDKEVLSGTHQADTDKTNTINFIDMEYLDDLNLFMGFATCSAWEGEAMIGIEADFSKLSITNGITKKVYQKK